MGRGARGGGGLRAGPGADAWLRGVRFWRGLARIHSVNRELETVWPNGFQLRLTPTSASAAHENPCWHGFAPHLRRHRLASQARPGLGWDAVSPLWAPAKRCWALTDLDWDARARAECEQNQPKYDQNARSMASESKWPRQGPSGHNRRGGAPLLQKINKKQKNRPLRGAFERGISFF